MDCVGPIMDIYIHFTMNNDSWSTKAADIVDIEIYGGDCVSDIEDMIPTYVQ
jgi:hypothetical protein